MTQKKKTEEELLRSLPKIAYRPSAAPPPPAKESPLGEFRINFESEEQNSDSNSR